MTRSTHLRGLGAALLLGAALVVPAAGAGADEPAAGSPAVGAAAVLFADGFEAGLEAWSQIDGTFHLTGISRHGNWGAEAYDNGAQRARAIAAFRASANVRFSAAVAPYLTGIATLMTLRNSAGRSVASLVQLPGTKLGVRDDVGGSLYGSGTGLTTGRFQSLELRARLQGHRTLVEVRRNGVLVGGLSIRVRNAAPFSSVQVGNGTPGRSFDTVYDDVKVTGT